MVSKSVGLKGRKWGQRVWRARQGLWLLLVLLLSLAGMPGLGASPVFALPPEPIDPEPVGDPEPFVIPANGFAWSVPSRFGAYANGIVDFHWDQGTATYAQDYVNPTTFPVNFDGCRTEDDESAGTSAVTYTWSLKGETRVNHTCRFQETFSAQGAYTVELKINDSSGSLVLDPDGKGNPFTQSVVVKDILIISLGDSYASGEGSPDVPQQIDGFGFVTAGARWQDSRCHRSANASPAQAALALEAADPHTSVTFLSFACSGATINKPYFTDAPSLDPYAPGNYSKAQGTGILGPYAGTVPPDPDHPQNNQLPSQIDQMVAALTNHGAIGSPRRVDALLLSGGGNDIGFGNIASVCTLYYQCPTHFVSGSFDEGPVQFRVRVQQDLATMPGRYTALATALGSTPLQISNVYITQYPDSTRNDSGGFCGQILDDVIPGWMQPLLGLVAAVEGQPVPLVPYRIDRGDSPDSDEVAWAGNTVLPGLNGAVGAAAQAHHWTLVDGIADASNLFSGHGYCASDNWIRRASEATSMQGPWDPPLTCNGFRMATDWLGFLLQCAPPATTKTKGTLHPTTRGYQAVAGRIFAKLGPDLLPPPPPAGAPPEPSFASSSTQSLAGANGWLIGHSADSTCPTGAANCAFAQVAASVAGSTAIRGVSLLINGVNIPRTACPATGHTANGVKCAGQLTNAQTFNWSFTFTNDGIYRLEFTVRAGNGTVQKFNREVRVDLHDPTAAVPQTSAPAPASGWYQTPVTLTMSGADGGGSGVQNVQYQLDGAALSSVDGGALQLPLNNDGVHTLSYRVMDFAGRSSASQSLTVNIDQTKPQSSEALAPAPNGAGWNKDNVVVTLSTSDAGGSGIQGYTFSATGTQPIASTTVTGDTPTALTINTEGVTTLTYAATDVAGNVESNRSVIISLDKTAPALQCGTPDGLWHAADASIACSASDNNDSGVSAADANFVLTTNVPANTETANAATGTRNVCDSAGNCAVAAAISGNKVDKKAPSITINTPSGTAYLLNQVVGANYDCLDGGSGRASCAGPVANGGSVDTATPGAKTFTVNASDNVNNASSQSVGYSVSYNVCALYDQNKSYKSGSTVPVKLQLCDAKGVNFSRSAVVVSAAGLKQKDATAASDVVDSGNANPDSNFRYDSTLNGYIFNLSSKGLATGTWVLSFTISGDPNSHTVQFDVK